MAKDIVTCERLRMVRKEEKCNLSDSRMNNIFNYVHWFNVFHITIKTNRYEKPSSKMENYKILGKYTHTHVIASS